MLKASANHQALTKLDFSVGAWWLSGADVLALADVLKGNTTVTDINFHGNSLGAQGAAALAGMLKVNTCVTALNLGGNHITNVGATSLAASLHAPTCALRSLLLYSNSIADDGACDLAFALGGTRVITSGRDKGATETNQAPNTVLTSLDLSANVLTCAAAGKLAETLATNSTLTHLQLTHNVLRDTGAQKLEAALENNWSLLKLTTEGNNFAETVRTNLKDLIKRNTKMHTLRCLQEQNEREFERVRDRVTLGNERVPPPLSYTGHEPIRHASTIDISQTDPHMYAALEQAAMLTTRASVRGERAAILADRAEAVVEAAASGSNRAMMALYRFR